MYCEGTDSYCEHEGNKDFGEILSMSLGCPEGSKLTLKGGKEVEFIQIVNHINVWGESKSTAIFKIKDTFFAITGDADSWDGIPDYTTPQAIVLVRPTDKVVRVYEQI